MGFRKREECQRVSSSIEGIEGIELDEFDVECDVVSPSHPVDAGEGNRSPSEELANAPSEGCTGAPSETED